jgi:serine protease Do
MSIFRPLAAAAMLLATACLTPPPARADEASRAQSELIRRVLPSVVNIISHARPADAEAAGVAPGEPESVEFTSANGSGFIVSADGTILTNWHVVAGAFEIFVTLLDGTRLEAEVLSATRIVDLALLKVNAGRPLQAVTWGEMGRVQVGDSVLAIGNPLGIGTSVSRGIVSALHRDINDTPIDDFIQTDAAINHGNSGGPMFNMDGEVIGVDSAIVSPTAANAGLGFALPAYQAQFMIEQLKKYGWVRPGWLGVKVQTVSADMARALGMGSPRGSMVAWLEQGGPAEQGGLRLGDVVVRFEEDTPADQRAFIRDMTGSWPGRHVTLGVIRDGQEINVAVVETEWPRQLWDGVAAAVKVAKPHWVIPADLGISVTPLTPALRAQYEVPDEVAGVLVTDVRRGTDAAKRGLVAGDVIEQVGGAKVDSKNSLQAAIDAARKAGKPMANLLLYPKQRGNVLIAVPKFLPVMLDAG